MDVAKVTHQQLRQYITYLLTEYVPRRLTGNNEVKLSPKTVRNVWVTLSAFFHWAGDEFQIPNPMKMVPAPKFETPPVEPFRREEIEAILKVCEYCQEAKTNDRHKFTMRRVTGFRDKAIVLVLVDSGLRASELCSLRIGDYDAQTGKVQVRHGVGGGAKGKNARTECAMPTGDGNILFYNAFLDADLQGRMIPVDAGIQHGDLDPATSQLRVCVSEFYKADVFLGII